MKSHAIVLAIASCALLAGTARGANSVIVESKTVPAGAHDVTIGVRMANDLDLTALAVPLQIREITPGSFITRLALSWGGRADTVMTDGVINNQYATQNFTCQLGGFGFGDIVATHRDSSRAVGTSPEGVLFARVRVYSRPLLPGSDVEPSMRLIFNVTSTPGTFEIDTTCTRWNNHLAFAHLTSAGATVRVVPAFTKGIITIAACSCAHHGDLTGDNVIDVFDSGALIDYLYGGGATPATDPGCPRIDRGDVNCDGGDDIFDVLYLNDYLYTSGPAPCNPCACSPYPANCP